MLNYLYTNRGSLQILFLKFSDEGERLELKIVKNIEGEVANELISNNIVMFESIFELKRTGYPGQHTKYIECPEKFKPKYFEKYIAGDTFKYFIGFSNSNFVAGACSDDLVKYKSVYGFMYCNSTKTMIELDYFTSPNSTDKINAFIQKINCEIN